jgi:ubiquinone/menaquinone biosynthesis C-methylase UbiE
MSEMLKTQIKNYWNAQPCGSNTVEEKAFTREYYDQIEAYRYQQEPEIFGFAQFTRYHSKKVLEVGVGMGSDFTQWVRAGAEAYGIDLTPQGIEHVQKRLALYGLKAAELRVGDAEALPFENNTFDLVYSWGVIHHSPDTPKALSELVRVLKPGGECKLMVYHLNALQTWMLWLKYAALRGKPWRSRADVVWHHQESIGTKVYTHQQIAQMVSQHSVKNVQISSPVAPREVYSPSTVLHLVRKTLMHILGPHKAGWFLMVSFTKEN